MEGLLVAAGGLLLSLSATVAAALLLLSVLSGRAKRAPLGLSETRQGTYTGVIGGVPVRLGREDTGVEILSVVVATGSLSVSDVGARAEDFDGRFRVAGSPADVALLDGRIRSILASLSRVSIRDRRLSVVFDPDRAERQLGSLLEIARRLRSAPADPIDRLRAGCCDADPSVRSATLRLASAYDPSLGRRLALHLLIDPDPAVRAKASLSLSRPEALRATICDGQVPLGLRACAADRLISVGEPDELVSAGKLLSRSPELWGSALSLLRAAGPLATSALIDLADAMPPEPERLRELTDALVHTGDIRAIPALRRVEDRLPQRYESLRPHLLSAIQRLQGGGLSAEACL